MPSITAAKKEYTLEHKTEENDKENDHLRSDEHFDDKQAAVLSSVTNEQAPLVERVSFDWTRNKRILVTYRSNKRKLKTPSMSTYLQSCMIPKDDRAGFFLVRHM